MLATHNLKFLDLTLKMKGIQKVIDFDVNENLICSKNIQMRQLLWACPSNAAEIRIWRDESAKALPMVENGTFQFEEQFPTSFDGHVKSVLVPTVDNIDLYESKDDLPYVATTPVPSLGLVHEVYKRGFETGTPNHLAKHMLQLNAMSLSNHGETLLMQSGQYRAFNQHIPRKKYITQDDFDYINENLDGSLIMFTARVENMNINSGLIAEGMPSVTSIGGFVHMLERETFQNINFAIGVKSVQIHEGKKRYVDQSRKNKTNAKNVLSSVRGTVNETTGTVELVLLLKTNSLPGSDKAKALIHYLETKRLRIAGGSVWDQFVMAENLDEYQFIDVKWLYSPASFQDKIDQYFADNEQIKVIQTTKENEKVSFERKPDILDCAIKLNQTFEKGKAFSINSNGYIFLEEAKERNGLRTNGYNHAFSEVCFCPVVVSNDVDFSHLFWKRHSDQNSVYWL